MTQFNTETASHRKIYLGVSVLLVLLVVGLVGGIIWYNFTKTSKLTLITAETLLAESSDDTVRRIELFYEPVLTIVALASRVPQISAMSAGESDERTALLMTGLRRYPQIFSLYVGYDNGDFDMVTRIGGAERAEARTALGAPDNASFAHELVQTGADGARGAVWTFLAQDGSPIERRAAAPTTYDPRARNWYRSARADEDIHRSEPYVFASSQAIGITLSRKLGGSAPGVFGADMALHELSNFLARQKITESSLAFVFNRRGEIVAFPDETKIQRTIKDQQDSSLAPTTIADLKDPVVSALFDRFSKSGGDKTMELEAGGRAYLAQVMPIAEQFGGSDYLGMVVPVDEITGPVDNIRSEALLYSLAVLLFVLPLYVALVFIWIDRHLGRKPLSMADFTEEE